MAREAGADLIYTPAKRDKVGLIIGLSGPSWSGKTVSALRLARGLAGPTGKIALLDTENKRGLTYADDYEFDHGELHEPFSPERYANAAAIAKRSGHEVLIVDLMSHEWAGPGGVLEMHEAELDRLTKGSQDFALRDAMKMVAWIKPKTTHKSMVQRLLQLNAHLILCFRAEEKTEIQLLKNKQGKLVNTPVNVGFQPITSKDMNYELTIHLGFDPKKPGVPVAIKLADKFKPFVPLDRLLDEETGARLAAWARGEKPVTPAKATTPPSEASRAAEPPRESVQPGQDTGSTSAADNGGARQPEPPPATEHDFPGDHPNAPEGQLPLGGDEDPEEAAIRDWVRRLTRMFDAVQVRADHFKIVDNPELRERITWLEKHRKDLAPALTAAKKAAWARTQPAKETAA